MFKNYFLIAWRNLLKNKTHSLINILGLSIGMAVALAIGLWIYDELTFDTQNPHYNRIARVIQNENYNGEVATVQVLPYPLAEELRKHYGGDFTQVVLGTGIGDRLLAYGEKKLNIKGGYYEPAMADLLDLHMLEGRREALRDPSSLLISASAARALFGETDAVGQTLKIDNQFNAKIAGVYADLPFSSTFRDLRFLGPWQLFYNNTGWVKTLADPWRPNAFQIYVQLTDQADVHKTSERIRDAKVRMLNKGLTASKPRLFLFPMNRWHLYSEYKDGVNTGGRIRYVWLFGIIGIFVLLLACINFMNLSTARSEKRAREVGIRKTLGSLRGQLIGQFFSESFMVTVYAFIFSLLLVRLSLPFFNTIAGKQMAMPWSSAWFWLAGLGFALLTGLVAGSYPAFYLSSFRPVRVLKSTFRAGRNAALPRKVLVVLQFTVSVILIIGTIVVYLQIQFAKDRPAGYHRDGLISLHMGTPNIHDHFEAVQRELVAQGAVVSMAEADGSPAYTYSSTSGISWPGKDPNYYADISFMNISWDYGRTIGWEIAQGRDFSRDFPSDTSAFVLNEAAVRLMGLKHPVGAIITSEKVPSKIIGVIKDMIMGSPYDEVRPTVFSVATGANDAVIARLTPGKSAASSISAIHAVFRRYNPDQPFEYKFVDDDYAGNYENEQRIGTLAGFFAGLAILISCLGLFGMASYMAEQRTREIGVRKVLGASVLDMWGLLSKDFILLVGLSLVIAIPLAWYGMHAWLQNYHYRATITWWCFALPAAGALAITLITVSFQTIRAATANPVRSLRTE